MRVCDRVGVVVYVNQVDENNYTILIHVYIYTLEERRRPEAEEPSP